MLDEKTFHKFRVNIYYMSSALQGRNGEKQSLPSWVLQAWGRYTDKWEDSTVLSGGFCGDTQGCMGRHRYPFDLIIPQGRPSRRSRELVWFQSSSPNWALRIDHLASFLHYSLVEKTWQALAWALSAKLVTVEPPVLSSALGGHVTNWSQWSL